MASAFLNGPGTSWEDTDYQLGLVDWRETVCLTDVMYRDDSIQLGKKRRNGTDTPLSNSTIFPPQKFVSGSLALNWYRETFRPGSWAMILEESARSGQTLSR